MTKLGTQLDLDRCPHCNVDKPLISNIGSTVTTNSFDGSRKRMWKTYTCSRCGGVVLAAAGDQNQAISEMYPNSTVVDDSIPETARYYLKQALDTLHSPAGSIMLSASSIDAMLKANGYSDGSLYSRINKAAEDHLITENMAKWAHEVRLDANDQRHADENASLPRPEDAQKTVNFTLALAEYLFVLPSRVTRGLEEAKEENTSS